MNPIQELDPASLPGSEMFEQFIAKANIGFGVQDADETVVYANRRLADMLGYDDPEDLVGLDAKHFFMADDVDEYRANRNQWPGGSIPMHGLTLCRKNGGKVRVLAIPHPMLDPAGGLMLAGAFFVDVTDLLAASPSHAGTEGKPSLEDLTARERQIVSDLVLGRTVRELAELHDISGHTVRNHIKAVYRKLGVHSRLNLMRVVMGDAAKADAPID